MTNQARSIFEEIEEVAKRAEEANSEAQFRLIRRVPRYSQETIRTEIARALGTIAGAHFRTLELYAQFRQLEPPLPLPSRLVYYKKVRDCLARFKKMSGELNSLT